MARCLASPQARRSCENASRPPAEAPTPTTATAPCVLARGAIAAARAARGFGVAGCGGRAFTARGAGRGFADRAFEIVFFRAMAAAADGTPVYRACAFRRTAAGSAAT